jgi:hypothetical protein
MKRTLQHPETGATWMIQLDDDEILTIVAGEQTTVIDDAFAERNLPPNILFTELVGEQLASGYREVLPDDLLAQVEQAHDVELRGRLRRFYAEHEYKTYQGKRCKALDCTVDFVSNATLGEFYQEFWDEQRQQAIELIPISSKTNADGYEDEQQWIGVDPSQADGPVYELFTSGAYEQAYASLDAFLADLE